jgi:hypothetical protein
MCARDEVRVNQVSAALLFARYSLSDSTMTGQIPHDDDGWRDGARVPITAARGVAPCNRLNFRQKSEPSRHPHSAAAPLTELPFATAAMPIAVWSS